MRERCRILRAVGTFQDSRDRIDRAAAHRAVFDDARKALMKRRQQHAVVEIDNEGAGSLYIEPPPLPLSLSLEFGEMLYQLRAALDACVYRAAILDSGQDPPPNENALEFPICMTAAHWQDSRRKVDPLTDEHRGIIEAMQPYNASKYPGTGRVVRSLGILNDWARKDRHRRIHVVRTWLGPVVPRLRVAEPGRVSALIARPPGVVDGQTKIARFAIEGWKPGLKVNADAYVSFDVIVGEPPPPADADDTLARRISEMFYAVRYVVELFEHTFEPPYPIKRFRPSLAPPA